MLALGARLISRLQFYAKSLVFALAFPCFLVLNEALCCVTLTLTRQFIKNVAFFRTNLASVHVVADVTPVQVSLALVAKLVLAQEVAWLTSFANVIRALIASIVGGALYTFFGLGPIILLGELS